MGESPARSSPGEDVPVVGAHDADRSRELQTLIVAAALVGAATTGVMWAVGPVGGTPADPFLHATTVSALPACLVVATVWRAYADAPKSVGAAESE